MFISTLDLFKIGIGPSSSHTLGPMLAARQFRDSIRDHLQAVPSRQFMRAKCTLKGSLAHTGIGHATDRAVVFGFHGYVPSNLPDQTDPLFCDLASRDRFTLAFDSGECDVYFEPDEDLHFDFGPALPEHPNGLIFSLLKEKEVVLTCTYFSVGGGFIVTQEAFHCAEETVIKTPAPFPFSSAKEMLAMSQASGLSIAAMKRVNELEQLNKEVLDQRLDLIWQTMKTCVENGLNVQGKLPGGLNVQRRACDLHKNILAKANDVTINDWLCAYAMAVNEENAAGHRVVTAPTNGAAGIIPAVLYYQWRHKKLSQEDARNFLLTAAAIGGIIKHRSSISGAEVGCQGEVGSAAAMAAAGLCALMGGTSAQIENAAEIALEHHLGMTCDPVAGLVQIPCIERNGFGAIKAYTAASLALHGSGEHFMPLDNCIAAMKETGIEMLEKYKETAQGGLAVSYIDC